MIEDFKSISPFSDERVEGVVQDLLKDNEFHNALARINYPLVSKIFPFLTRNFMARKFRFYFDGAKTVKDFQTSLAPLVRSMINKTTSGFTITGEKNLKDLPTLFIGNHRDIALDPLFLNYSLFIRNYDTVRIAIGDNLLDNSYAEKIMRLNKSFVVHRNISGVKKTYKVLKRLSAYIYRSINEDKESVWIAQREGRANDGNDFTEEAVLKMLHMNNRKEYSLDEWVSKVNLTPVVISYEFDPLDTTKAAGRKGWKNLPNKKNNKRVLEELVQGIVSQKGRVHLHICKSLKGFSGEISDLAKVIDGEIITNIKIWPISHGAAYELSKQNSKYEIFDKSLITNEVLFLLKARFGNLDSAIRDEVFRIYAAPLVNKEEARISSSFLV